MSLGLLVGACIIPGTAAEDQEDVGIAEQALGSDGPFTDTQSLINYWSNTSTGGALTQIFLNGSKVYQRSGFGPAFTKQYFDCYSSDIYAVCPTDFRDGFTSFDTLVSRFSTNTAIYQDGVLVRSGTGAWANISKCTGDDSFYGCIRYYKVVYYFSGFGPAYASTCYPHNSSSSCP
jgi:hypothetical protein